MSLLLGIVSHHTRSQRLPLSGRLRGRHRICSGLDHQMLKEAGTLGSFCLCVMPTTPERANRSISCMRIPELLQGLQGAGVAILRSLHPVQASLKKDAVLWSSGCGPRMSPPRAMEPLSMLGLPLSPLPSPNAACMMRLRGVARSLFWPDIKAVVDVKTVSYWASVWF